MVRFATRGIPLVAAFLFAVWLEFTLPAVALALAGAALVALLWRQSALAHALERRNRMLIRSVRGFKVAEGLAGIGRWCIELPDRRHLWSQEMCNIAGLAEGTAPSDDVLARLMPDGLAQLDVTMQAHEQDRQPFVAEFEFVHSSGQTRILRARASNVFAPDGCRERVFMVVRDVTEEYDSRRKAEREREDALALAAKARREADTDALTGLASRRSIMADLDRAVLNAQRSGQSLSIVIFDIDHFKQVNDSHGHLMGDKVLAEISAIAIRQAGSAGWLGRIGGEEFLWLLPGRDESAARDAAERLRWAIEAGTHSAAIPGITISAGLATWERGEGALQFFARADAGLYDAKRAGRNRVARAA